MPGLFCVFLERTKWKVAKDSKDRCDGHRRVDGWVWWLSQAEGFASQETAIADDAVDGGEGKQQTDERVEV